MACPEGKHPTEDCSHYNLRRGCFTHAESHVSVTTSEHVKAHEHAQELGAAPETLCVAGDSAGGGLSAAVALMARDKGAPHIALQLMVCPVSPPPYCKALHLVVISMTLPLWDRHERAGAS